MENSVFVDLFSSSYIVYVCYIMYMHLDKLFLKNFHKGSQELDLKLNILI